MSKPTPGPWTLSPYAEATVQTTRRRPNHNGGFIIAECFGPDRIANARLIAGAPDMLRFLAEVACKYPMSRKDTGDLLSLLAKVRGEG